MSGPPRPATRILDRPDGTAVQIVQKATLAVVRGPDKGRSATLAGAPIVCGADPACDLVLADDSVSARHFEVRPGARGFCIADLGSTNGTVVDGLRVEACWVDAKATIDLGRTRLHLRPERDQVEVELSARSTFGRLFGASPAMRRVFADLERAAATDVTVLVEGESGTGKELAAESLHLASPRRDGPFVVVDCGAIPESLVEAELFGHERGAFTGADRTRPGYFAAAHGGTLFLDEIGELPLRAQPKLLRALEAREIVAVGSTEPLAVDVRVVAATNRKLAVEVEAGRFRRDLFYRLAVLRVELPPLRERPEDVPALVERFADAFARAHAHAGFDVAAAIGDDILLLLRRHTWPGNVRELKNVVERLLVLPDLGVEAIGGGQRARAGAADPATLAPLPFHEARQVWTDRFERAYLEEKLRAAGGVVLRAAEAAAIPRQTFHRLMKKHGI